MVSSVTVEEKIQVRFQRPVRRKIHAELLLKRWKVSVAG
jgi:hypothetical protein